MERYKRELSAALAFAVLVIVVGVVAPTFLSVGNVRDLAMNNAAVLLVAIGMTMVIISGEIDISVGSQFAVCTYLTGALAKHGMPIVLVLPCVMLAGVAMGAVAGSLVAWLRMPSIVVTLALMVAWRDGLRWATEGAWVQDLPANFQWVGLGQTSGELSLLAITALVFIAFAWMLSNVSGGRSFYAVGSDAEAARLAGIDPRKVVFGAFALTGALVGLAAVLNATRFSIVPSNAGMGLELKAIAAVVVGGTAITGGRGRLAGTLIGVALLGTIGTALTFLGINPFWEKAIQGAVILAAVMSDVALGRLTQGRPRRAAPTVRSA
ncbi:MAG TPA: ABC transporter permease [Pyrinomonadaceae bacterium]|nr:ABC transporter permease [Pyrinomonadaceae bacterium]